MQMLAPVARNISVMIPLPSRFIGFIPLVFLFSCTAIAGDKMGERLTRLMREGAGDGNVVAWVYFSDKGAHEVMKTAIPADVVSERSLQRRSKVLPPAEALDYADLPVDPDYVRQVAAHVVRIRQQSRWFNSVSVEATRTQLAQLESLPFVKEIELVARFWKDRLFERPSPGLTEQRTAPPRKEAAVTILNYGPSYDQVNLENIPSLHSMGNYAQGVIIGMFDNGFRLLRHQAFDSLRARIIATYDFVDHKVSVAPYNPDQDFGGHGVNTLSTIGGYAPGQLIGPAFGASYILARTENDSSGLDADFYPSEEDNWIAAIEWADSLGVEVTSTSLGYLEHVPPAASWTWQDMDGKTIPISRAATMAARKGIIVVNSAGNNYQNSSHNTLNAPADADSILTVGAVDPDGSIAYFSSVGPTVDGRIKPDVMAQGTSVYIASAVNPNGYGTSQGTSFSCPLAAGVAALLLNAFPSVPPMQIVKAMKTTASIASSPNNFYGWGIVDAHAAYDYLKGSPPGSVFTLEQNYPNPFNLRTSLMFKLPEAATVSITVYDILGREVRTVLHADFPAGTFFTQWDGNSNAGTIVATGVYLCRMRVTGSSGNSASVTRRMMLLK